MSNGRRTLGLAIVAALSLALATGCARSRRAQDRAKVLEAENINLRQRTQTMQDQMRQAHAAQDDAQARAQQINSELAQARLDAQAAEAARLEAEAANEQLAQTQLDLERRERELADANKRLSELRRTPRPAPRTAPRRPDVRFGGASPELEAMRRDLQQHLASYGVRALNVEVRTDRSGRQRVAIVLPDAFPSGKATLAYNADAVKAVISVGKMINTHYPKSAVLVEGHTDSDPIRKSKWGTNENLSLARAQAVETLLTNSGVSSDRVTTVGHGARRPLAAGTTKRAKSRNRRVEIFLTPRS